MNRNVNDQFTHTPTPHFPRNRFDMGIHKKLFTFKHGRLVPFYVRAVYPGDTWQDDPTPFIRMDTSAKVPLDDIFLDTYFFFVPYRILDPNFAKVLGDVEPYDEEVYSIPQFTILGANEGGTGHSYGIDNVLPYLGYSQASAITSSSGYVFSYEDTFSAYPLAAYYKIYNDWFRDENVDPSIPYEDLFNSDDGSLDPIFQNFDVLPVNKYHDFFTSATISPQKGPAVTIPLGTSAPVITGANRTTTGGSAVHFVKSNDGSTITNSHEIGISAGQLVFTNNDYTGSSQGGLLPDNLYADLSKAAGSINELRLSFAIQSLYERRNRFGTRYIETIRGQWGIEVPDSFFQRPEYLGGSRVTLNNVPVLSTNNASQLGAMSGNSATIGGSNAYSKTFIEYGLIIGLCCTRIHHSYGQGKKMEVFGIKDSIDLYNPVFANIGFQSIKTNMIYNRGNTDDSVFAYQEAWSELRAEFDEFKGQFGIFSSNSDLRNKWHYGDYYGSAPTFSATWLKENASNVAKTLTGQLINGASSIDASGNATGHQFMVAYYVHPKVTRILPAHSIPVELIGRL